MRFWWVNQKQTFTQEVGGGYLWSPKRKANGHRNPYYEFMREVAPGDVVFSYAQTRIRAIGIARSYAYECPKPAEFGSAGMNWDDIGWKVDVGYVRLNHEVRPADHADKLQAVLPSKYSPLSAAGFGQQNLYLTRVPPAMAELLVSLIGREARTIVDGHRVADGAADQMATALAAQAAWEEHLTRELTDRTDLPETEREAIVLARRGQGLFKQAVASRERRCRLTGVDRMEHLRASHCKPWRDSSNDERLDGENGLLLTPTVDHLFDRGFISFEDKGRLLVSPVAHRESLERMSIPAAGFEVGRFSEGQRRYLDYHRNFVFLEAKVDS